MGRKRYTPEQIIGKLREAEVLLGRGQTVGQWRYPPAPAPAAPLPLLPRPAGWGVPGCAAATRRADTVAGA